MTDIFEYASPMSATKPGLANRNPDFKALAGAEDWSRLQPAIRRRFSDHSLRTTYPGELSAQTSRLGFLFAVLLYPFGKPLPVVRNRSFAAKVKVYPDADGGIVWQRNFLRQDKSSLRIESVKQLGADGNLMECIRPGLLGGIGMGLRVYEKNGGLNFASTYYFVTWDFAAWGKVRLSVPLWLTPGRTLVEHMGAGSAKFRFRLTMTHPWFGQTVCQDGVFYDPGGTSL